MDKMKKEDFIAWAKSESVNWLLIGEGKSPEGYPQENYLTPASKLVFMVYDNDGFVRNLTFPIPMPTQAMPSPMSPFLKGLPGMDFPGGQMRHG